MPSGVILIILAGIFYTASLILGRKCINTESTVSLVIAIMLDFVGTVMMKNISASSSWPIHSIIGSIALSIMTILMFLSVYQLEKQKTMHWFRNVYKSTYVLWLISFILGYIENS